MMKLSYKLKKKVYEQWVTHPEDEAADFSERVTIYQ
jgi:hypothetical protein